MEPHSKRPSKTARLLMIMSFGLLMIVDEVIRKRNRGHEQRS